MTAVTGMTVVIAMTIIEGVIDMTENEHRAKEHEELIAALMQIAESLKRIERDLFWMVHSDERY